MTVNTPFSVEITASDDEATAVAKALGKQFHLIEKDEPKAFGLTDSNLKDVAKEAFGRRPDDAWLRKPTRDLPLYDTPEWGFEETTTTLEAVHAKILGIDIEPTVVKSTEFVNNSSVEATFETGITDEVQETVSHTWSSTDSFSAEQKISYSIGFLGTGGGGETSTRYEHTWGEAATESRTVTVGSHSSVQTKLAPGQGVVAKLKANRGTMKVRVTYRATLDGDATFNYAKQHEGHHFYALGVYWVLDELDQHAKEFTEDIEIGYYSKDRVELEDLETGEVLAVLRAGARPAVARGEAVTLDLTPESRRR